MLSARPMQAVHTEQAMKTACPKQPTGMAAQEVGASGPPNWYMWRGQLHVGTIDVGLATLWSEHMTCIPALGGVLKMTRIAKYEDLWTKILKSKPCSLSQRSAISIRGRTVAVHRLLSHSRSFQQLVEELTETSKPQLLVCHLLNDKHHVEVVLVPHCQELEQCGLHGHGHQKPHMLHIMFVCQQSAAHIASMHQPLDAVDLSQMNNCGGPKKKSESDRLVTGLQVCKNNSVRKVKKSDCKDLSSWNGTNITGSPDGLANKSRLLNISGAPPPESDRNRETIDLYDGRHASENTKNNAVNLDARTKDSCQDRHKSTQALVRDRRWVIESDMHDVVSPGREQPLEDPAQEIEMKMMESRISVKGGVECTTKALKVLFGHSDCEQLPDVGESVTSNISQDVKCRKIRNSSKNLTKENKNLGTATKCTTSGKWSVHEFSKTYKPTGTLKDTHSKIESQTLSSHHSECSDLDSILLKDEKLKKKVCVVVSRLSPSLLHEKEEKMGMRHEPRETRVKHSLLDTQKFRSLFSLQDSRKLDLIKPSMLKRNSQENVCITPPRMDDEQKASTRPENDASLEINKRKERKETKTIQDKGKSDSCNISSCHQMNDSGRLLETNVNDAKRQKTANEGDYFLLKGSGNNACDTGVSSEVISGNVKSSRSKRSKTVSDCLSQKCTTHPPAADVDFHPNTEQLQELDSYSCSKQTVEKQGKMSCSIREPEVLENSTRVSESSEHGSKHTSASDNILHQNCENNPDAEKRYKRKRSKRKVEYKWGEGVDDFHPRKRACQVMANGNRKYMIDSECEMRKTPVTDNGNISSPVTVEGLQEKVENRGAARECNAAPSNTEVQKPDLSEQQDRSSQQQQASEIKDSIGLKQSKSCHLKPREISNTLQFVEKVQVKDCQEICGKSGCTQDHNHNFLLHKVDPLRTENVDKTKERVIIEQNCVEEAEKCKPGKGCQLHDHCSAVSSLQRELPSSSHLLQSQSSNYSDTAVLFPALPKEMTHDCIPKTIGAASSCKQGLSPGPKHFTGIACSEGILVKQSEVEKMKDNSIDSQCGSDCYISKCDEILREGQESAINCVAASKLSASDQLSSSNINCSSVRDFSSLSKQGSPEENYVTYRSVSRFQQPPKDDLTGAEESKYKKDVHPTNPTLPEMSRASTAASPCPKVLAKRLINNIKYCMLKLNSSSGSGLLGFGKKYECIPVLQASVDTFFMQNTPRQSELPGTQKSLSSERIFLSYGKTVFEKILKKMRLQLLSDANLINDVGQCPSFSGINTLASFVESQVASPSQAADLPEALDNKGASVLRNYLVPHCGKSLIAQQVAELHCPYKTSTMKTFYGMSCRVVVSSGILHQSPRSPADEGVPMNSSPADCSPAQDDGQQYSSPISLKKPPPPENISSALFSSLHHKDQINKLSKTIDRTMFVPNELYHPCWEDFPCQHPLDGNQNSKFIHLFQGRQQDIIKLKCLLVTRKKSYGTLRDIELCGGHVLVQCTVLDQLLASPQLPKLCASPSVSFGVYGSLAHVLEGRVGVVLADVRMLLLLHHAALLDPKTSAVLQVVGSRDCHHMVLVPVHTLHMCVNILVQRSRAPAEEKYREVLKQNLTLVMKCVEAGAGHILGGSQESVCARLSPASPLSEYLACLRVVHRCLNFAHRYTAVLIGEGINETSCYPLSLYRLCSAREVLQDFPVVVPLARNNIPNQKVD